MKDCCIIMMGVSGSGKTLIGQMLAKALNVRFIEGDDLHPRENVEKMKSGVPLNDRDRLPWLTALYHILKTSIEKQQDVVLSCSALKADYRSILRKAGPVTFLFLDVPESILKERLEHRKKHFMPPGLLDTQLQTLEPPKEEEKDVITIQASGTPREILISCLRRLRSS